MTSAIKIRVGYVFDKDVKKLRKSYPSVDDAVHELIRQLKSGELPGRRVRGVNLEMYKTRLPNRSAKRGKSDGFRVYYLVQPADRAISLITIYSKTDQEDINVSDLRQLLRDMQ